MSRYVRHGAEAPQAKSPGGVAGAGSKNGTQQGKQRGSKSITVRPCSIVSDS
jgi:hypothetical protein